MDTLQTIVRSGSALLIASLIGCASAPVNSGAIRVAPPAKAERVAAEVAAQAEAAPETQPLSVLAVAAGNEIVLSTGHSVILIGVEADDNFDKDGASAFSFLLKHTIGKPVVLSYDLENRDFFGRELAYVEIDGQDLSATLIRRGLARAECLPPNIARCNTYASHERTARHLGLGIWAGESSVAKH